MLSEDREAIRALKRDFDELATLTETNINAHLSNEKRIKHYTTVFTAATRNGTNSNEYLGYSPCEILYNDYQEMLEHFLLALIKRVDNVNEERCIGVIIQIWKRYKVLMSENIHIFSYLSRFYIVNKNKASLKKIGLTIFWEFILKRHINTLVEFAITSIANQVHMMHNASWTPELIECVHLMYAINEEQAHFDYEGIFLAPLLVALRDKYASLLIEWVAELGSLALVNQLICAIKEAQSFFELHFAPSDVKPIIECIEDVFLSSTTINKVLVWPSMNKHTWNEDDDGLVYHILHKDENALSEYYRLFSRREHTLTELARLTTRAIIINANAIAKACHIYTRQNTLTRYIHALLEMEVYYMTQVMSCYNNAPELHKAVCDGLESVFNHAVSIHLPQIRENNVCFTENKVELSACSTNKDSDNNNNNNNNNITNAEHAIVNDNLKSEANAKESLSVQKTHYGNITDKGHVHLAKTQYAQLLPHYIHQEICKCSIEDHGSGTSSKDNDIEIIEGNEKTHLNRVITEIIHILSYIHDREVFFAVSRDLLAQRILFPLYTFHKDHEQLVVNRLRAQYGSEKTAYLEGILHDYDESVKFNSSNDRSTTTTEDVKNFKEKNIDGQHEEKVKHVKLFEYIKKENVSSISENIQEESIQTNASEPHSPLSLSLLAIKKGIWPAWVTTTTHDEWILPTWLSTQLDALRSAYLINTHDRLLHWALGNSYAEMEYAITIPGHETQNVSDKHDTDSSNTVLTLCLSALQALILLLFNRIERCTMTELSHYLHASSEDLTVALIPLVRFHILSFVSSSHFPETIETSSCNTKNGNRSVSPKDLLPIVTITHKLQSNESLYVSIDAYYTHSLPITKTRIILHPSMLSSASSFDALDTQSSESKSKYDQSVVLDLRIMKLMKENHTLSHQQLISHCQSAVLRHFSVEPHLIKQRIDNLLQRGYIVRDKTDRNMYHYQS